MTAAILIAAAAAEAGTKAAATGAAPGLRLAVRVEPAAGTIHCRAEFERPQARSFFLARDLAVQSIASAGRRLAFVEAAPAADGTREVTLAAPVPQHLEIVYEGALRQESYPRLVGQVNGVRPGLVELAGYVGWVPRFPNSRGHEYEMTVDVPAEFSAVTNGQLMGETRAAGRARSQWRSYGPTGDVVLAAAPGLRTTALERGGVRVELLTSKLPAEYVERMAEDVARAAEEIATLVGRPSPSDVVRVLYSPRPGWGYVRTPLIIVSEESAVAQRTQEYGPARDLRYIAHEVAHYWWHLADSGTPEDWINEGLAEYSAFLVAEKLVGRDFAAKLVAESEERSRDGGTTVAIVETPNAHADREVNRYARPVLLLEAARRRHGAAAMASFLRALYERFSADRATTGVFLEVAGARLGAEEQERFREALHRTAWADAATRYAYSPRDSGFLGTWRGPLKQGSETHEVVLHLVLRDGTLVATIDSPDQGVSGIPVPSVGISGDRLRFGLGAVGVTFAGRRFEERKIAGEWKQGGAAVPLVLAKVE